MMHSGLSVWRSVFTIALTTCLSACGSLPPAKERANTIAEAADISSPLARIVAASAPLGAHSGVRLMPLGVYSLDARIELAKRAQHSLVVQYYVFETDGAGRLLLRALKEAADRGVQVRLLVDDLYTVNSQAALLELSRIPNIEVRLYNPFCCGRGGTLSRFAASLHEIGRLNHRMHNKLFLADGVMAVIGGRNIANAYFTLNETHNFVDMDALVVGLVVAQLEAGFDAFWNSKESWPIAEIMESNNSVARNASMLEGFVHLIGMSKLPPSLVLPLSDLLGYGPVSREFDEGRIGLIWGEAWVLADPPSKPRTMSAEEALATSVTMQVWRLVLQAYSEVDLSSPYLVPGERGMEIINALTKRGVRITMLTNSLAANDVPLVHTAYVRYRRRLLASAVNLYELSPARTTANLRFSAFGMSSGRLHAKLLVIDRQLAFIGSMNLDPRSATQNTEMGIVVASPALALEILRIIDDSRLQNAYRLRLAVPAQTVEWLTDDGSEPMIQTVEPETGFFQRLYLEFIAPFVPESLL